MGNATFRFSAALGGLALLFSIMLLACDREEPATPQRSFEPPPAEVATTAPGDGDPWQRCAKCHRRGELAGTTAEKIRKAFREVPRMKIFAPDYTDEEIESIAQALAAEGGGLSQP